MPSPQSHRWFLSLYALGASMALVWAGAWVAPDWHGTPQARPSTSAWADQAPSAINTSFAPLPSAPAQPADQVALGRKLFHDPRLSATGEVACASCHPLNQGGADMRPVSIGVRGQPGGVNAPTVLNAALNFRQFWDGRAVDLEDQAGGPLTNPVEMASDWPKTLSFLERDAEYLQAFKASYPDGLTQANVRHAIASFERTLLTPDAPFDRYLKGDASALSATALAGFKRFKQIGCASCHQGVNLGGNLYQRLGIMEDYFADKPDLPAHRGRYNVTRDEADRHYFKVPTLRNVALTAPYFHDATAATLQDAVRTMARYQLGLTLPEAEVAELVAFLQALTGRQPTP